MSENVIFCYSGTGNCLDMAKTIARKLGDTDVGFVFPCYGGGLPGGVEESLRKIQVGLTAYTFGVCQYAGYMGSGLYKLNSIIPLRYWTAVSHQCTCIWLLPHSVMLPPVTPAMAQRRADKKAKQLDATGARILFAPVEALPMASSALRARLAAGERCENELPPLVRRVIQREGLYRETKGDEDRNDSETGKRACAQPPERSAL